jgi:hypothetical protein
MYHKLKGGKNVKRGSAVLCLAKPVAQVSRAAIAALNDTFCHLRLVYFQMAARLGCLKLFRISVRQKVFCPSQGSMLWF